MHKSVSLADQVYERLEKDILSGKYTRGTILTELRLCEDLGVSRTPVREALRMLEQEHIVESCPKGVTVLSITVEDADAIYGIRERIEGMAAAGCARNITDEQIRALSDVLSLQEFYAARHDSEKVQEMDSAFHEMIYRFSGSSILSNTLFPLHNKIQKFRKNAVEYPHRANESIAEHRRILEAIASRDPDAADQAITEHAKAAHKRLIEVANSASEEGNTL